VVVIVTEIVLVSIPSSSWGHLLQVHHQVATQVEIVLLMLLRGARQEGRRTTPLVEEVGLRHTLVMVTRQGVVLHWLRQLRMRVVEVLLT
jgi:hypothetical protein